jgi:hypothetical protein
MQRDGGLVSDQCAEDILIACLEEEKECEGKKEVDARTSDRFHPGVISGA